MKSWFLRTVIDTGKNTFSKLFGNPAATEAIERAVAGGMGRDQATAMFSGIGGKSLWGRITSGLFKGGAVAGAADLVMRGKEGIVGGIASQIWTGIGQIEAEQNVVGRFHGFYKTIQEILKALNIKGTFLNTWAEEGLARNTAQPSAFTRTKDNIREVFNDPLAAVQNNPVEAGVAGLAVAGGAALGLRRALGSSTSLTPPIAVVPASALDPVAAVRAEAGSLSSRLSNAFGAMKDRLFHTRAGKITLGAAAITAAGITYAMAEEGAPQAATPAQALQNGETIGHSGPIPYTPPPTADAVNYVPRTESISLSGLYNGLSRENITVGNAANLANSALYGATQGLVAVGSALNANLLHPFSPDVTTGSVYRQNMEGTFNPLFKATVGLPDLSTDWSKAAEGAGSMFGPGGLAVKGVNMLRGVFGHYAAAGWKTQLGIGLVLPAIPDNTTPEPLPMFRNPPFMPAPQGA